MEDFKHYRPLSSQFPIPHNKRYDVFLSFRGPDVRKTLVDHLYQSLNTAGLHVFLDTEKLKKGEDIGISLQQAIQNSAVHIPIFSINYAHSTWCLRELALMWEWTSISRDAQLIPLFYNVEPSDVRYPRKDGSAYAEAFDKHFEKARNRFKEIEGWQTALYEVSCLSGWSLKEMASGHEGRFVKQVVSDVLDTLKPSCLDAPKHLVGLKGQMKEIIIDLKLNERGGDRLSIGIWGMGGLGKTTLSKALYNDIHREFEAFSFVSNVGATKRVSTNGLVCLQQQILRDLVKIGHIQFTSVDQGTIQMRNHLRSVRALVILDDVYDVEQLDALLGDWYGAGSRIIVTSRDERVLKLGRVDKVYQMKGLERDEAVELILKEKSLITIQGHLNVDEDEDGNTDYQADQYYNIFYMHDHIRDMGRRIDEEESGSGSGQVRRIWREEHLLNVMSRTQEMPNIRGLMWKRHLKLDHLDSLSFMPNLKFLFWWNLHLKREIKMLPSTLRYLVLCNCKLKKQISSHSDGKDWCHFSHVLPKSISQLKHLCYLDLSGTHQTSLPEEFGELHHLKELYLVRCCLKALPQSFGDLINLKNLDLSRNLLSFFPASFQHLKSLVNMEAADNRELVELFGIPKGLVKLNLRKCSKLRCVSTMSTMQRLKTVDLSHCKSLTQLPLLKFAKTLRKLKIGGCKELVDLPALPEDLVFLDISGCSQLQENSGIVSQAEEEGAIEDGVISTIETVPRQRAAVFKSKMSNLFLKLGMPNQRLSMPKPLQRLRMPHQRLSMPKRLRRLHIPNHRLHMPKPLQRLRMLNHRLSMPNHRLSMPNHRLRMPKSFRRLHMVNDRLHMLKSLRKLSMPKPLQRLCMIDCDISKINIWRLLEEYPYLKKLEVSINLSKVSKEFQRRDNLLLNKMNFEVTEDTSCQAVFISFVLCGGKNVCLPKIHLETSMRMRTGDPKRLTVKNFKLPSFTIEDGSEKDILRICIYRDNGSRLEFDRGDIINCLYTLQTTFPQGRSPLKHVNISFLPQERYGHHYSFHEWIENALL